MMKKIMLMALFTGTLFIQNSLWAASPYVGQETRSLKSLSPEQIEEYLAGKGMGLAKAAELNHYPGPAHVLELIEKLKLTPQQKQQVEKIFQEMQQAAKSLGKQIVDLEKYLDELFSTKKIDDPQLKKTLNEISTLQGQLRYAHLAAHLQVNQILNPQQVADYDRLRGYHSANASGTSHSGHKH